MYAFRLIFVLSGLLLLRINTEHSLSCFVPDNVLPQMLKGPTRAKAISDRGSEKLQYLVCVCVFMYVCTTVL